MLHLDNVITDIATSGLLIVGRDVWLARRQAKNSEAAERRNQTREPFFLESMFLGNTKKVAEIFQASVDELVDAKKRALDELRETKVAFEDRMLETSQELERYRKMNEADKNTIRELYVEIGEMHKMLEELQKKE